MDQDYTVDVEKLHRTFIGEIDSMRSLVNVGDAKNNQLLAQVFKNADMGDILSKVSVADQLNYQESRISAFCRMIGFPVISSIESGGFYNPGYDKTATHTQRMDKVITTWSQSKKAGKYFDARENFYNHGVKSVFKNVNGVVNIGVMLLQTGFCEQMFEVYKHIGSVAVTTEDTWDTSQYLVTLPTENVLNQAYADYSDNIGTKNNSREHILYHFIYPLVTDGRVEIILQPSSNTTTVPFAETAQFSPSKTLKRPLLETIIKKRFYVATTTSQLIQNSNGITAKKNAAIDSIRNDEFLLQSNDPQIVELHEKLNASTYSADESIQLSTFIINIEKLIDAYIDNQRIIGEAQSQYYWLPKCEERGPEFGVKSNDLYFVPNHLNSRADLELLNLKSQQALVSLIKNATSDSEKQDDYVFSAFYGVFAPDNVSGFVSEVDKSIKDATSLRTETLSKAEKALREIELITGAISGLGLIDVMVTLSALHIMDRDKLVGFLDEDAFNRAKKNKTIQLPEVKPALKDAYEDLENQLSTLYHFVHKTLMTKLGKFNQN